MKYCLLSTCTVCRVESQFLELSSHLITQTKPCFLSSVKHCDFTPEFSNSSIFQPNFGFPWRFEKLGFHCMKKIKKRNFNETGQFQKNLLIVSQQNYWNYICTHSRKTCNNVVTENGTTEIGIHVTPGVFVWLNAKQYSDQPWLTNDSVPRRKKKKKTRTLVNISTQVHQIGK